MRLHDNMNLQVRIFKLHILSRVIPDKDAWTLTTALLISMSTTFLFPLTGSVPGPI